jgi:hypothetical protein
VLDYVDEELAQWYNFKEAKICVWHAVSLRNGLQSYILG